MDFNLDDAQTRQMTDAYESIGIDGFLDLCEDAKPCGEETSCQGFRATVRRLLAARTQRA